MKIVIVGDGKVGFALTQQLAREDHDIVVIDSNKMVLKESQQMVDIQVVHGNGASPVVQSAASVGESDLMIAATSADEINLLCCIVAKKLGCSHTIARVRNPEYYGQFFLLKDELGLNLMINPERATASEIFRLLQFPSFLKRDAFAKGRVEIVEVVLRPESHIVGKLLSELYHTVKVKVLVCAVERGNDVVIPDGSFRLQAGDKLYVTASSGDLARLIRSLHLNQKKIKTVMIIGGSRIAVYLAMALLDEGVDVKLIEIQKERCRQLAELLPKATVIFADGSDRSILDSEGIDQTDAVVTLTDIDEENLIVSMYANYLKVPKVITKINRTEYTEVFRDKGIDCVVSPKELCTNDIVRYVRAMGNRTGGAVVALHRIVDEKAEALEFRASESFRGLGQKLSDLELKPNILLSCINRRGKIIIPSGNDAIEKGDTVIVVTTADRFINDLNDILDEEKGLL